MAHTATSKLFRIRILFYLLLLMGAMPMAAQVTRAQLLKMFYKANSYRNAGNDEKALEVLWEISSLAPKYPDPYLRMAEIYDDAENIESAIVMYRKYINLEMNDDKIKDPSERLKVLETQLGIKHYADVEEQQAESMGIAQLTVSDLIEDESEADEKVVAKKEEPKNEENTEEPKQELLVAKEETQPQESHPVVEKVNDEDDEQVSLADQFAQNAEEETSKAADNNSEAAMEVTEDTVVLDKDFMEKVYMKSDNTHLAKTENSNTNCELPLLTYMKADRLARYKINTSDATGTSPTPPSSLASILSGKWVSSECNNMGHETWIFNIAQTGNTWFVSLDDASGVYMPEEKDLLDISWKVIKNFLSYDHSIENKIKELKSKTVSAQMQNEVLLCTFTTEHQYKPHTSFYTWGRNILEGVSNFIPFGGIVSQMGNTLINYVSEKDQQKTYTTTLQFHIKAVSPEAMRCEYVIIEKERSIDGEKTNTVRETCWLYKVNEHYKHFSFKSENETNIIYKKLYSLLKQEALIDNSKLYPLAYMSYYGAGTNKSTRKAVKYMTDLIEKENCNRAKAWLIPILYNLSMDDEKYPLREHRKYFKNHADDLLGGLLLQKYPYAYSLQADIYATDDEKRNQAVPQYQEAAQLGDIYALYKLGLIYMEGQLEPRDIQKSIDYLTQAAEKGYADAYLQLALLYKRGRLVEKSYSKYTNYLYQAINEGSVQALKELSEAYYLGLGVKQSFETGNQIKESYMKALHGEWKEIMNIYGYNTIL